MGGQSETFEGLRGFIFMSQIVHASLYDVNGVTVLLLYGVVFYTN